MATADQNEYRQNDGSMSRNRQTLCVPSSLVSKAKSALEEIAAYLLSVDPDAIDLASGASGIAVFLSEWHILDQKQTTFSRLQRIIAKMFSRVESQQLPLELYAGLSGVAWSLQYVGERSGFAELGLDKDVNEELNYCLEVALSSMEWPFSFELILGLSGLGIYALESNNDVVGKRLYRLIADRLHAMAIHAEDGVTWFTSPELIGHISHKRMHPNGYYNLGISHGVPGIIAFLGKASRRGYSSSIDRTILAGAVKWLLRQSCRSDRLTFPNNLDSKNEARTAWCYGDLGISMALLQAALGLRDDDLRDRALSLAVAASNRPEAIMCVREGNLCHGSVGIAHIYHRLHRISTTPELESLVTRWLECALDRHRVVGRWLFPSINSRSKEWETEIGYLTGIAGIGLALIDILGFPMGVWDAPLLTDI